MESLSRSSSLFEHDLRANAFRVCREGKPVSTFPGHALADQGELGRRRRHENRPLELIRSRRALMIAIIVTSLGDHYSYGSLTLRQSERARDHEARGIEGAEDWEGLDTRVPELRDRPVSTQHERFMTSSSEEEPNLPSGHGLFVNDIT